MFCSADHTDEEFHAYYATMPWLAISSSTIREELMGKFSVRGIPQLTILSPSGNIIVQNATNQPLSIDSFNTWMKHP